MKLQKLAYYSQAWSLVWDDVPLFDERIEAWANGPVVRDLYMAHKGQFTVHHKLLGEKGSSANLTNTQRETIDAVLDAYGKRSAQWLSDQTHAEAPWLNARENLPDNERGNAEITLASMAEYYSSLS
ncbi:Panacea domain-containing protein [Caballeronia sp. SBC1]|uniref:Panacea domain-containing protein n=1 Tax=Caballeronia sp. SBC1 TaxID=2705548 RepID=UPI001A9F0AC7|nr:type II toxin-antitoxin system antitoxin SocA domain-containing protein [Caballeronia sp. SBC1]